jgi:hypothetical protein
LRRTLVAGLVSLVGVLLLVGRVDAQAPNIQVTFVDCDANPEVVFVENLGDAAQDLTGWTLQSDPVDDPSQRYDLSTVGSLAPGDRARIFSGGGPPSADPETGRFLWAANDKYRDGDPSDFVQLVNAAGVAVSQLDCGGELLSPTPAEPQRTPAQDCDPSYPDVCIPVGAGDYDCAGGQGDGPNFIEGPLQVLPPDPHDLDPDGDGVGCETPLTSEVAGVAQSPDGPAAGFGPSAPGGGGAVSWFMAGLAGAGIAWLVAGAAGVGFATLGGRGSIGSRSMAAPFGGPKVDPGRGEPTAEPQGAGSRGWFAAARDELANGRIISAPPFSPRRARRR